MIHLSLDQLYKPRYVLLWMLLSLKAGYLNAAGFLATGNFVSHVTGFGTQVGMSLSHSDYMFGAELLIIPLAFILGSSVPAWVLDWKYDPHTPSRYHTVQFLITLAIGALFFAGVSGFLGEFSTTANDDHDIMIAGTLCFICGMKNGLSTWATHGKIRTTHLTGLSTDIGLNLPKLFRNGSACRFPEARRVNTVRILTFASFSFGSLVAAFVMPRFGFWGLLFPLLSSILLSTISYIGYVNSQQTLMKEGLCPIRKVG